MIFVHIYIDFKDLGPDSTPHIVLFRHAVHDNEHPYFGFTCLDFKHLGPIAGALSWFQASVFDNRHPELLIFLCGLGWTAGILTHIMDTLARIFSPGFSGTLVLISEHICLDFNDLGLDAMHTVLVSCISL